jgi:hypothetical protein
MSTHAYSEINLHFVWQVNHELVNRKVLDWQTGYGVVSFGTKDLDWVVKYIRNQKKHHKKGTAVDRL